MGWIILALVALFLYYHLIIWLFVGVGPLFLFYSSILFSLAVPISFYKEMISVYRLRHSWPGKALNILFLPVSVLLLMIHLDMLWLILGISGEGPARNLTVPGFYDVLQGAVLRLPLNRELLDYARWMLPEGTGETWIVALGTAFKSLLLIPCLVTLRGFASTRKHEDQPGFLAYFHGQAFIDLKAISSGATGRVTGTVVSIHRVIWQVTRAAWILIWPLTLLAYLALLPLILIATVIIVAMILLFSAASVVAWLMAMTLSPLLSLMERAIMLSRAGYAKCPHAACHKPVPLPVFMCPECGVKHDRLLPGRFGLFRRMCICGKGRLPTLFWFGKGRLDSLCPHCSKPMHEELFAGNIHIPIYGGPSTGKTMYMMAVVWELLEKRKIGMRASLIDPQTKRSYENRWRKEFARGKVREKTARSSPDAFLLDIRRDRGLPASLYLYDPAGEALLREDGVSSHGFMRYFDGLALLIDPLSLPSFAGRYRRSSGPDLSHTTSRADPEETLARIVNQLERLDKLSRSRKSRRRLAVILTKADIPGFRKDLGLNPVHTGSVSGSWNSLGKADSEKIRAWLAGNEPHLLQTLETRFSRIRFFASSALGGIPEPGKPFRPSGVIEPMAWLLAGKTAIAHPVLAKTAGRMAEVTAALVVIVPTAWLTLKLLSLLLPG